MTEANEPDQMSPHGSKLGGAVFSEEAVEDLLQRVVQLARLTVGAHSVSISVAERNGYRTSNSTGDTAYAIDQAQYRQGGGPCIEAIETGRQLQVAVDAQNDRWPLFVQKARDEGVLAVLSTPLLRTSRDTLGALNVYACDRAEFGQDELNKATALADHASVLVGKAMALVDAAQLNEQLRQAVESREIIGEAKGILMERQSCTRDEAFDILRRASQRENRKLRELAEELVLKVEGRAGSGPAPQ